MTGSRVDRFSGVLIHIVMLAICGGVMAVSSGCASAPSPQQERPTPAPQAKAKTADPAQALGLTKSFDEAVARGDQAWSSGQADMAIYLYVQALSFKPRDVATLGKLGSIEQRQGDLALAARAFELAANEAPNDAHLSGRLGLIYMALGDEGKASKWLKVSADNGNTDWRVLDQLSVLEFKDASYPDAVQYANEALTQAPSGVALPLLHRGQALYEMKQYTSAEEAARDAIRIGTNLPEAWRLLGKVQAKRGAYPASIDSLLQVMDTAAAYNAAGKLALDNGDNAVALRFFEKSSLVSPVYMTDAQHNAAIARERLGATVATAKQ